MEKQIYSRVTEQEYAELERHAATNERSLAAELRLAIRAWLEQHRALEEEAA